MPLFSILLPTHNRADVLPFALGSVLRQTVADFELLVVGDGCTDHTAEVVAQTRDPRVRWFDLPKGPGYGYGNRNVALRQARGELVAFMAHDDIVFPDHLARLAALFADPAVHLAYSRPLWVTTDGIVVPTAHNLHNPVDWATFQHGNFVPAACVVHRRSCLQAAGNWPEDVPHSGDWHLWRRILRPDGRNMAYEPVPTALHFVAAWKKDRASLMPEVARMLPLADTAQWWPPALKVDATGFPTEQAAFAHAMDEDPSFVARVRAGVIQVLDHLARSLMDGTVAFPAPETGVPAEGPSAAEGPNAAGGPRAADGTDEAPTLPAMPGTEAPPSQAPPLLPTDLSPPAGSNPPPDAAEPSRRTADTPHRDAMGPIPGAPSPGLPGGAAGTTHPLAPATPPEAPPPPSPAPQARPGRRGGRLGWLGWR